MRHKLGRRAELWLCSVYPPAFHITPDLPPVALRAKQRSSKFLLCNGRRKKTTDCKLRFLIGLAGVTSTGGWLNAGPKGQGHFQWSENKPCEGLGSLETLFPAPRLRSHTQHHPNWQKASGSFFSPGTCAVSVTLHQTAVLMLCFSSR